MIEVKSILIIDDDEDDLFLIKDRLSDFVSSDCKFVSCSLKEEALGFLKERTFDLCILDHRLAGYEGIEILEAVAEADLATPIIMLTGQNDEEVAKKAIKSGAQDFVMKSSIDENIFEKSVRYAISRKELEFARMLGKQSEAENVAKDKFIAHLSHELRTPLTSILGYTALLLEKDGTAAFEKELKVISNNGKHLLNLLNDVLDLSKIAANKFELKERAIDLQELLIEVSSLLSVNALDKGLFLDFSASTKLPKIINLDGVRFKQIMLNLVGNAVKFTDSGGISVDLSLIKEDDRKLLNIQIKDTGIGMAEHQINTIFAPFRQLEDVANRRAGGAGLGLSITAELVKEMGGELKVESTLNEGSLFVLTIPCLQMSDELTKYDFSVSYDHKSSTNALLLDGRILVVDDVFEIRQLAGYFVKETGVHVEFASNGQQALDKIDSATQEGKPIDVILMDLHMPVLTGKETVKVLRKNGNECTVIAMTAALSKGLHEELLDCGFDQLISKPLDKSEIWKCLENVLPNKKSTNISPPKPVSNYSEILVHLVEDDLDSALIMQMMLEQIGCEVLHSASAKQAIKQSRDNMNITYHLLDLGLPDMDGESFIRSFFEYSVSGAVTILSGNQPTADMMNRYPIAGHLIKPIDREGLKNWLYQSC